MGQSSPTASQGSRCDVALNHQAVNPKGSFSDDLEVARAVLQLHFLTDYDKEAAQSNRPPGYGSTDPVQGVGSDFFSPFFFFTVYGSLLFFKKK